MNDTTNQIEKKIDRPDWLEFFLKEFDRESDRAAVILASALIDDTLRELLDGYLLSCPSSSDPLFDGNGPMSSFSSRIELSYRLGLISRDFASGLNILRRIRNSFAHDLAGCSFESQSVRGRVDALCRLSKATESQVDNIDRYSWKKPRDRFCYVIGYFLWCLKHDQSKITLLQYI